MKLTDAERAARAVPERDVVRAVLDYCAMRGGYAWRNNAGSVSAEHNGKRRYVQFGERGMADILCVYQGRLIAIECKTETGKQSPEQKYWQWCVEQAGGVYLLVRPSDYVAVIEAALEQQQ